ncbi:MAG: TadE/TadG family type IV pilus assembly protein [Beijerinckiaceae bacterium]
MRSMRLSCLRRFARDRKGNIAMIFALVLVPVTFAIGMGVDYTSAARKRSQLNAAADAAAMAAVTPAMMAASDATAQTAATNMFNAQIGNIPGLNFSASNLTVTITDNGLSRTVKVCYTASTKNAFAGIIKQATFALAGCSTSASTVAPNIDFYLLLDSSPSMAIAATAAGIATMVANTSSQGGCAFACHESNPSGENPALGNPHGEDNYTLARNLGVTLRIDMITTAAQNLMTTAANLMTSNNASYRAAIYTFDVNFNTIQALTSNLSNAQTQAGNITMLEVYTNNWLTSTNNNSDTDTNSDNALSQINSVMPNPGGGTKSVGDSPQEVMFFVTDGVEDENVSGSRVQSLMNTATCTTIKNRGIRIAVLYLTYLPLPTNAWYNTYIAPFQPNIGANLQSCASPGLYTQVTSDSDISDALAALFQTAVSTARLTQ